VSKIAQIGEQIKHYRLKNDIRQEDMARKLGISRATLINYEKGHTSINVDFLGQFKILYPGFEKELKRLEEKNKPPIIQDNIIDFAVLFKVLYFKKRFIIFSIMVLSFLGLSGSFLFTKYYTANLSLYPAQKEDLGLGQFQSLASNIGLNMPENAQDFNIPDIVQSRMIIKKVLDQKWKTVDQLQVDLFSLWGLNRLPWYSKKTAASMDSAFVIEKAINIFKEHMDVTEDRRTGLININISLEDPFVAAGVANFIGNEVQNYIQKENSAQAAKEKAFIFERLKIVKAELEFLELDLKEFKERNRGYDDSPELYMLYSQIFREVDAKNQVYATLQQQLELSRIEEVKKTPSVHILDSAVPPARKSSPNRLMIMIFSGVFGFISSTLITLFKY